MSNLPSFMVLASNTNTRPRFANSTYTVGTSKNTLQGLMSFNETNVFNPKVKLAVEPSATGNRRLVHIRSCYDNKYLVPQFWSHLGGLYVAAAGDKPEEDQSKETCTLFEYIFTGDNRIQLRHAQTKMFASCGNQYDYTALNMINGTRVPDISNAHANFSVIDWERLLILPSRVSFKSEDGKYLRSHTQDGLNYQTFFDADIGNPEVGKELFPIYDGKYRIKDLYYGKFLRLSPNWIWADADESNTSDDTLFTVVKLDKNVVALRSVGNNNFVGPLTADYKTNCLNAHYPQLSKEVRLVVEELVISREIYDITYRLSEARVYEGEIIEKDSETVTNHSPDRDSVSNLNFSVKDTVVRNWSGSVSFKLGVKTEFKVSWIPFIAEAKVELSAEFSSSYTWGESNEVETARSFNYEVTIPPMTTMKANIMATRAKCDVPFSYTQRDLLPDGRFVTTIMDDGIYTGINSYDFYGESSPV